MAEETQNPTDGAPAQLTLTPEELTARVAELERQNGDLVERVAELERLVEHFHGRR